MHLDEKWFFSHGRRRYLLLPEEKEPICCVQHKLHITKVMFLCAVVRPCFNLVQIGMASGKLKWETAKRMLVNMLKGTLVWKNKMVTQEVYQDLLISKLLPAILQKWPRRDQLSRKSFIQQDGEKNHISENDRVFKEALMEKGSMGNFALKHYKLAGFGVFWSDPEFQ